MNFYGYIIAAISIFTVGFTGGFKFEHARWNVEKASILVSQVEIERLQNKSHDVDMGRVIKAANNASDRAVSNHSAVVAAGVELDRLRSAIANHSAPDTPGACADTPRTIALRDILAECSTDITTLARQADGHVNDVRMFLESVAK